MSKGIVLSLFDYTAEALKPWAAAGYNCYAFDIQHPQEGRSEGGITYAYADLHNPKWLDVIKKTFENENVVFAMGWPVCQHMAVSGAAWFASKAEVDPEFQVKAVRHATRCADLFDALGVPYMIENPVSVLATKWRKPNHSFHPYEFGEYIPEDQGEHPRWPEYIAPFDAYTKKTCLWTGGGYKMPPKMPTCKPTGYSTQHKKLGGKSKKTKDIRSATPRGFAIANFLANQSSTINRSGPQT